MSKRLKYALRTAIKLGPLKLADAINNRRHRTAEPRILITRPTPQPEFTFDAFFPWVTAEVPELRSRMEFRRLPVRLSSAGPYTAHVSWVGDTFDLWSPQTARWAARLEEDCRRHGVAVINPATNMPNTGKGRGAALMRSAGVRTPHTVRITDPVAFRRDLGGLEFPFLIREERCHGQRTEMVKNEADLARIEFHRYRWPIAAEFIDTREARDGLYRKYRYVVAGEWGMPRHMIVNPGWEVRPEHRVASDELRAEELEYINRPDPNHELFQRARRALGLDVVGFDFSFDRDGRVVIWEANAFLDLRFPDNPKSRQIFPAVFRTFALVSRYYLERMDVAIPAKLDDLLGDMVTGPTATVPAPARVMAAA